MDALLEEGKWVSHHKGWCLWSKAGVDIKSPLQGQSWEKTKDPYLVDLFNPNTT